MKLALALAALTSASTHASGPKDQRLLHCAEHVKQAAQRLQEFNPLAPLVIEPDAWLGHTLQKVGAAHPLKGNPKLTLEGYDYLASGGVEIDDLGFLPSIRHFPGGPRRVRWTQAETQIDRSIGEAEVREVHNAAKQAVHDSYEGVIQPEIIELVNRVEAKLDPHRISFGVVRDNGTGKVVGAVRVAQAYMENGKLILPSLEILRARGLVTPAQEEALLKFFEVKTPVYGPPTFRPAEEIGQFYIDKALPAAEREATRERLLLWLAARNVHAGATGQIEIVHTSRKAHEVLWGKTYGFSQPLIEGQAGGITDKVQFTTSPELHAKLSEILDLPK